MRKKIKSDYPRNETPVHGNAPPNTRLIETSISGVLIATFALRLSQSTRSAFAAQIDSGDML